MKTSTNVKFIIFFIIIFSIILNAKIIFAQDNNTIMTIQKEYIDQFIQMKSLLQNSQVIADTLWVIIAGVLVFFMNLGFGMVESGLQQSKNSVNICAKNFIVFGIASLTFWFVGWGLMFGNGNGFIGIRGLWMLSGADNSPLVGDMYDGVYSSISWAGVPLYAKFFFQLVFAATAATIVSGAVGGRIKFISFIIFSAFLIGIMYPITGHWIWGGGWLQERGFWDFAGSTVVHSVGGWAALSAVMVLGPRFGKYNPDGSVNPIPGHSMTLATIGVFILWLGWFGFNPGSTMSAIPEDIARICVTTNSAAASGAISATIVAWLVLEKPDLSMILNGALAGLVAITAPCAFVGVGSSIIIGIIAGILVVVFVISFDRWKIDDPVGAISVHLVNGIWGTLAVGLFAEAPYAGGKGQPSIGLFAGGGISSFANQLVGVVAVGAFTFVISWVIWIIINATIGIRVSYEEEIQGLDIAEHGMEGYPDFESYMIK